MRINFIVVILYMPYCCGMLYIVHNSSLTKVKTQKRSFNMFVCFILQSPTAVIHRKASPMFIHCYIVSTRQLIESKIHLPLKMWGLFSSCTKCRPRHIRAYVHRLIAHSILNTHKKYETHVNFKTPGHLSCVFQIGCSHP
jgi:hypothetical protein